jgi:quercetin dioxygenase-like cupin family protein
MEIRRFGPGHRRPDGPAGTQGVTGQVIHHDEHAAVSELAFQRHAMITPHSNPNATLFIVISGGGYVQVGDERTRVNHGEAVVWPPDVPHGAYTDGSEMRAIVIELPAGSAAPVLEGRAHSLAAGAGTQDEKPPPAPAQGALADRPATREDYDASEGEPW